jgi:hypothetical protein
MTVSRLERPVAENIFFALTCDPGEIRDLTGGRADAGEQRQAVGAHRLILIVYKNMLTE